MIVDAHAHIFERVAGMTNGQPTNSKKWGKVKVGNKTFQWFEPSFESSSALAETYIAYMDWCNIDKGLIVNNIVYGYHNDYVANAVLKWPDRLAALALVDITKGEETAKEIDQIMGTGIFKGIKLEIPSALQCCPGLSINDKLFSPFWRKCNELKLTIMVHLRPNDIKDLEIIYQNYSNIVFIISHLGNPPYDNWENFLTFAQKSRIFVEISALPFQFSSLEEYPYPIAQNYIHKAKEALGAEKLIWGSDFPMLLSFCTYQQTLNLVKNNCNFFSEKEKKKVLGENIANLLNL